MTNGALEARTPGARAGALMWQTGAGGVPALYLDEEQRGLVQGLELNLFYDGGEGYIDLGLDSVFTFDESGGLPGKNDGTWLAINGQPVACYHTATTDDGTSYAITGQVPVRYNGRRAELILRFDSEHPHGFVAGVQFVYPDGETGTAAKARPVFCPVTRWSSSATTTAMTATIKDSRLLGEPLTVTEEALSVSGVPLEGPTQAAYRFTDRQHYWIPAIPSE